MVFLLRQDKFHREHAQQTIISKKPKKWSAWSFQVSVPAETWKKWPQSWGYWHCCCCRIPKGQTLQGGQSFQLSAPTRAHHGAMWPRLYKLTTTAIMVGGPKSIYTAGWGATCSQSQFSTFYSDSPKPKCCNISPMQLSATHATILTNKCRRMW